VPKKDSEASAAKALHCRNSYPINALSVCEARHKICMNIAKNRVHIPFDQGTGGLMSVSRRLGAVLRLSSGLLVILALAWIASAVATGPANHHLLNARAAHTATAQVDGSLLIAGGTGNRGVLKSLEFFDPVSGRSTPGPRLLEARSGHSAIALADGRVLLSGGRNGDNALLASSELYDASGASLNPGASMGHARANHTST
jgi:hypothetical protein